MNQQLQTVKYFLGEDSQPDLVRISHHSQSLLITPGEGGGGDGDGVEGCQGSSCQGCWRRQGW